MISLDSDSPVPAFEQIRSQIAGQILGGDLPVGQRLPSIRQLAGDLRIAPGTVARAYAELEFSGMIVSNRATGSRVAARQQTDLQVKKTAEQFVIIAKQVGINKEDALGIIRSAWEKA